MRNQTKRVILALLLLVAVIVSLCPTTFAAGQPSKYSSTSNSGDRDTVCTTLDGTSASSYYTGSYAYDVLSQKSASVILDTLRTLTINTHTHTTSYDDCKNYADKTDCENNSLKCVTIYSSYTTQYDKNITNREHVWPKSLGSPNLGTSGPGSDLHHIRPSEITPNSNRGSLKYGEVTNGKTSYGNASGYVAGTYGSYFEPNDNVKGDVARICLYMYVRYGKSHCQSITTVFQSVDVLLEWCALDPVDTWEMGRNEVVQKIQGNRNVFIDYPEYAWLIFGRSVPSDMVTPSGEASGNTSGGNGGNSGSDDGGDSDPVACPHTETEVRNAVISCTENGYSGDTYCVACDTLIMEGTITFPEGHDWQPISDTLEQCTKCKEGRKIDNTGVVVAIAGGSIGGVSGIAVAVFFLLKRRPI